MADWLLLGLGLAAGSMVNLRDLPLAAIGLGTVLVLAAVHLGVFW
jgi:hypothetical protein